MPRPRKQIKTRDIHFRLPEEVFRWLTAQGVEIAPPGFEAPGPSLMARAIVMRWFEERKR